MAILTIPNSDLKMFEIFIGLSQEVRNKLIGLLEVSPVGLFPDSLCRHFAGRSGIDENISNELIHLFSGYI